MSRKGGMVHFNVHFEVAFQPVSFQETDDGFGVDIILVLGRLHGFRLNQEGAFETLCAAIVTGNGEHLCQMFFFSFLVGIQQRHISFASAPKDIVCPPQFYSGVNRILNLNSSTGHNIEIGIGSRTVHVTSMAEYIGCSPQ